MSTALSETPAIQRFNVCCYTSRSGEEQSHGASAVSSDSRSQDDDNLSGSWLVDDEADANEPGKSHGQHKSYYSF